MIIITIGKIAELLEITVKMCNSTMSVFALLVYIDLSSNGVGATSDRSLCFCTITLEYMFAFVNGVCKLMFFLWYCRN